MARFGWKTGLVATVVALAALVGMMVLSSKDKSEEPATSPTSASTRTNLQFAVWGSDDEVAAYQAVVDDFNASSKGTRVTVKAWPDAASFVADFSSGEAKPDLYLLPRTALPETMEAERNRPLLDLLDAREVPVGDDFARDAVAAFSVKDELQCMPYASSPMVIYYNADLIDFDRMDEAGLPTPNREHTAWNLAEFEAAADFASRPRTKARGVYIEPSLRGLAPFVYAGGGKLFDSETDPKSLTLADGDSASALRKTLEVLRVPRLTLTSKQLEQRPALDWFKSGKLGMIAGFRGLTPELRATEGLNFDVMPMPNLGTHATIGETTGLCVARGRPANVEASANFLTYLISDEVVARLANTGYLQPAKLTVSLGDDFLQPAQQPEHSAVFTNSLRDIVMAPLIQEGGDLVALINPDIEALFTSPSLPADLGEALSEIDDKSRTLLDPDNDSGSNSGDDSDDDSDGDSDDASDAPSGSPSDKASSGGPSTNAPSPSGN